MKIDRSAAHQDRPTPAARARHQERAQPRAERHRDSADITEEARKLAERDAARQPDPERHRD